VVFTSDHGEGLGDHGIAAKPMMPYECVNRVPAMWKDPSVAFGSAYAGVMSHLDLTPRFIELAGAETLPGTEGRPFARVLTGGESAQRVIAVSSISETSEYPVPIGVFHA